MKIGPLVVSGLLLAHTASGEPVVSLRNNGPVENRINMVILGDGYTQAEQLKFASDVDRLLAGFFADSPYAEYQNYFNVSRIDVVSNESGADHPERNLFRDTALGAAYNCGGIQRTICANSLLVNAVVNRSVAANARDLIVVVVNDSEYGGSGGSLLVTSTNVQGVELMLHESGHTLGLLADEYTDQPPVCVNAGEPPQLNVTSVDTRASLKWNVWVAPTTPVPTVSTANDLPGLYVGARNCSTGLYRPTYNSKMRSLNRPFETINREALILRYYNFVSPIDAVTPTADLVVVSAPTQFVVVTAGGAQPLTITWRLDGNPIGSGRTVTLPADTSSFHTLEVEVSDRSPWLRPDFSGILTDRHSWRVKVNAAVPLPKP